MENKKKVKVLTKREEDERNSFEFYKLFYEIVSFMFYSFDSRFTIPSTKRLIREASELRQTLDENFHEMGCRFGYQAVFYLNQKISEDILLLKSQLDILLENRKCKLSTDSIEELTEDEEV